MTIAINIAYLEIRLSGGAANTDPDASLGGDISTERVLSQSASGISNITGVTIDYAAGNATGAGTLAFVAAAHTLQWTPNGGSAGTAVDVDPNAGEDGKYTIKGSAGFLLVSVDVSALPVGNQNDTITIANIANEVYDDVSRTESFQGDVEYRCLYLKNTHAADPFLDAILFIPTQPSPGVLALGVDPAGPGNGLTRTITSLTRSGSVATAVSVGHGYVTNDVVTISGADQTEYNGAKTITRIDDDTFTYAVSGSPATPATGTIIAKLGVATSVIDEGTAPSGVTFSSPSSEGTGVSIGQLDPGEVAAFWFKRTIPLRNTTSNAESLSLVSIQAYY